MRKNIFKIHLSSLFLILTINTFAQTTDHSYKGAYAKVGKFYTGNSFLPLNTSLEKLSLLPFDNSTFMIGYGYTWVKKKGFSMSVGQETLTKREASTSINQTLLGSGFNFSAGYEIYNKKRVVVTPNLGVGFTSLAMTVSELPGPNSANFNNALFLKKQTNTITKLNGNLTASLTAFYKIPATDSDEKIENGTIHTKRYLPVGLEIGYRYGTGLSDWLQATKLSNSPETNLSGFYFTLKFGGAYKQKEFRN